MTTTDTKPMPESDIHDREANLERILKDAIAHGYHACDESVAAVDEPRHGCMCWVAEAKIETGFDQNG